MRKIRKIFVETILNYSSKYEPPYLLTGDLGFSVLESFRERFPDRFINVGIAEQSLMSIAAGIASKNNKVFAYSIANFATFRALEQLRLDIGLHNLDVCVVGVGPGFQYGPAGYTHWAIEDLAIVSSLEQFRIFTPSNNLATEEAILDFLEVGGPTYIRLGKEQNHIRNEYFSSEYKKHVKIYGFGENLILSHGPLASKIISNIDMNFAKFSIVVFNEIPLRFVESDLLLFSKAATITTIEDVIFPGSLGSRAARFIADKGIITKFKWIGVNGLNIDSTGGSENFLIKRELGIEFIDKIFDR